MKNEQLKPGLPVTDTDMQQETAPALDEEAQKRMQIRQNNTIFGIGLLLLLPALLLLISGFWMFTQTRGTHLLYVIASSGRFYTRYWVFIVLGLLFGLAGVAAMLRHPYQKLPKQEKKQEKKEESSAAPVTETPAVLSSNAEPKQTASSGQGKQNAEKTAKTETAEKPKAAEKAAVPELKDVKPEMVKATGKTKDPVCPKCGNPVKAGNKFCLTCGQKLI